MVEESNTARAVASIGVSNDLIRAIGTLMDILRGADLEGFRKETEMTTATRTRRNRSAEEEQEQDGINLRVMGKRGNASGKTHYRVNDSDKFLCNLTVTDGYIDAPAGVGQASCVPCRNAYADGLNSTNTFTLEQLEATRQARRPTREPRRPREPRIAGKCGCGCDAMVGRASANFLPGHDAKLKSLLLTREKNATWNTEHRGDENFTARSVPEIPAIALSRLSSCSCCDQPIFAHESGKGPVCRTGRCKCSAGRDREGEEDTALAHDAEALGDYLAHEIGAGSTEGETDDSPDTEEETEAETGDASDEE